MKKSQKLISDQDMSINFVLHSGQEARFVRRTDDYIICYLSSHNGCNKACRFCHLTQTGQTQFSEASMNDMLEQACMVLGHYRREVNSHRQKSAQRIHFNWMARGEPLASSVVTGQWTELTQGLLNLAHDVGVSNVKFNISSIFPDTADGSDVLELFDEFQSPVIFYSLYSLNPQFRKRWLPKAKNPQKVLEQLSKWQKRTGGELVLHWALIEGENDDEKTTQDIVHAIGLNGLSARFNLVRYNPHSAEQGKEPSEATLENRFQQMSQGMLLQGSRIVPRVGFDVKASCGMFVHTQV